MDISAVGTFVRPPARAMSSAHGRIRPRHVEEGCTVDWLTGTEVPTEVMVLVVAILSVSLVIGVPLARAAGKRRGHRLAHPEAFTSRKEKAKDTALFLAALVPSLLVWLAVMGVSFIGLTGFAKDVMSWNHWTNILVPL